MASFYDSFKESSYKKKKNPEEERNDLSFAEAFKANSQVRFENDDIAPVREDTEDKKWYQKIFKGSEAFDDGWDFGDGYKAAVATTEDLKNNIYKGFLGIVEGAIDTGASIIGGVGGMFGATDFRDKMDEFAAREIINKDKVASGLSAVNGGFVSDLWLGKDKDRKEELSVSGDTMDSWAQSGGQLMGVAALGAANVPWWVTTGVTSYGNEFSNALNQGATHKQASLSGLITAGAEIITEKISGGIKFGGTTWDDLATKRLATGISNRVVRTAMKMGMDVVGEGGEEVLSGLMSAIGQKITYASDKEFVELFSSDDALEAFVGGAVLGGASSGFSTTSNIAQHRDATTGLTANEETVFKKVYDDALADAEKGGKKLTEKQKNELYDNVMESLKKGEIGVDTIESLFGGEDYKAYKSIREQESPLLEELKSIENNDTLTDEQKATLTQSVEAKLEQLAKDTNKADVRAKLDKVMQSQMIRQEGKKTFTDDYLLENYNQDAKRRQAFEADLTKYDAKQQEIVKKAIDSGVLNNTRRTHELVDMIAKISADKGVSFDFINNKKLKESGFAVDGKTVNGYYNKATKTIGVNIEGAKYLNSVVGHEVTHVLEGTEVYTELQKAMFEYAKSKGEYDSRRKALESLYKAEDIDSELTSDLVGDYLFTDSDFIKNLSVKHRNVFQKIYDEIKYLCKVATAGSKEARELERVKKAFEDAYRESGTKSSMKAETKHSLTMVDAVQPTTDGWSRTHTTEEAMERFPNMWNVSAEESEVRNPTQITSTVKSYRKVYEYLKNEGFNGTILDASSGLGYGTRAGIEEYGFDVEDIEPYPDKGYNPKYTDYSALDKKYDVIISNAVLNVLPQDQRDALAVKMGELLNDGGRMFINVRGKDVETLANTGKNIHLGNMEWIETVKGSYQKGFTKDELKAYLEDALGDGFTVEKTNMFGAVSVVVTKNGNTKYSLSDSDGKQLTKEQSEYFKDSKMRDENGNLKVMYHGSQDAGFHEFDSLFSDDNASFFFVDRNDVAASYSGSSETYTARTFRTAEDFNKFFAEIGQNEYEVKEEMYGDHKWFVLYEDGSEVASSETAKMLYDEFRDWSGLGEGQANYKVYLNLTNPLVVDAEGRNWNELPAVDGPKEEYRYIKMIEVGDVPGQVTIEYAMSGDNAPITETIDIETKFDGWIAQRVSDLVPGETMEFIPVNPATTRDYAQHAKENGYDGVIFNNVVDNGGYGNGSEGASTVAIAFDSNQIKSVANAKPTGDPDIRYSLAESNKKLNEVGLEYDQKSDTVSYSMSSLEDAFNAHTDENGVLLNENDYQKARDEYVNALARSIAVDKKNPTAEEKMKASKYLDGLFLIHDMIAADKDRLDYEAAIDKSAWVSNSEYGGSIDFSTLCAKRRLFTGTFDAIQNALPDTVLDENDFLKIRDMLLKKELESPCSMCYVEGSRAKHGVYVDKWLKEYLATNPEWKPQIADFTSSTRLERTRIEHPEAYAEYQKAMNKLAQRKPKEASVRTDYKGEILVAFEDGSSVEIKNQNGGIRFNSFSDFEIIHALDCMQVITDMARVGLNGQAYTKVKEFAESFGNTGLKINLSLVAKDVDANGKLIMDEVNGMKYADAMEIRNKYSDNVGTVIVVFNDNQLRAALADSTIDYVLPFHRSQWKKSQYTMMGLPTVTKDYTALQNDRIRNPKTGKPVKLSKLKQATTYTNDITGETYVIKDNIMPNMYWDYSKSGRENADRYLGYINANGMTPKFDFLLEKVDGKWVLPEGAIGDGYFKLLIDFKMYNNDGWGSPQNPVMPEFNMPYIQQMLNDYVGGHQAFPVAHDVVDAFVKGKKDGSFSLSMEGEAPVKYGNFNISGDDVRLEAPMQESVAPIREDVAKNATTTPEGFAPISEEKANALQSENIETITDEDVPPEAEAPYYEETSAPASPKNPFTDRDYTRVGSTKTKAFVEENPDAQPFFQEAAQAMLGDLRNSQKGQKWYNYRVYYESGGKNGIGGVQRETTADIADLLDGHYHYTYQQIDDALNFIINGEKLNACAKRIEFALNERLLNGYTDINGMQIPPNQDYINLLNKMQTAEDINLQGQASATFTDSDAPPSTEDVGPVKPTEAHQSQPKPTEAEAEEKVAQIRRADPKKEGSWWSRTKKKINDIITLVGDKGWAVENLAKKTGNRELEAKYDFYRNRTQGVAQEYINEKLFPIWDKVESSGKREDFDLYAYHLHNIDRMSLDSAEDIATRATLKETLKGYTEKQIERLASTLITSKTPKETIDLILAAQAYVDLGGAKGKNKAVFGNSITADVSRKKVAEYEASNPEFKAWGEEVVAYNKALRELAVAEGLISQKTADLWEQMYPHYVPISRTDRNNPSVSVPLDTNKTGVNSPFKRAEGGNSDFEPLLETMAKNTEQIFRAVFRNRFGVELMNTLKADSAVAQAIKEADPNEVLEAVKENDGAILKEGKNGIPASFTVFVNGKRVEFDIPDDIYEAVKPTTGELTKTYGVLNKPSEGIKKLMTEYNPIFALWRNPIKDSKDVLHNSQHALKTYLTAPETLKEIATKGKWFQEYAKNGGKTNSYYDSKTKTFVKKPGVAKKVLGFPIHAYQNASQNIEMFWRLSEYIASRKEGRSIEVSMLDAARVTTNFGAGSDLTKFLNRNGAFFLNPSVQGAMQIGRNIREAHHQGLKGYVALAGKVLSVGLGGLFLNHLLWDDDEDYEDLSDYVKQNYFIIAKGDDGKFIRIPKGRMEAVIQNGFEQMENLITGDDEVDLETFAELVANNLAPNNPFENNIFSTISQINKNETWYGEDLVPSRLQDLPASEQYDESTDSISKWIGEHTNTSPYKWNYLFQQYGGGLADTVLPMLTPEAESGSDSVLDDIIVAPWRDEIVTDSVLKNQNVSDFYDTVDELTKNANSMHATDEDVLASKYMNSISSQMSELYKQKRQIQNSSLSDSAKYQKVRQIQEQINALAEESLNTYGSVNIDGGYATVGDMHYRMKDGKWTKISDDQLEKQEDVVYGLGISPAEYWRNKTEYDFAYENPEKYAVAKSVGGYSKFKTYTSELYDIKADVDKKGKTISGSRKKKVIRYINSLDADYGEKLIIFKHEYQADDTYNYAIIKYLNSRNDISYEEMRTILIELGFYVDKKGNITWD